MDKKISNIKSKPNYHKIYRDIISDKYPEKEELCQSFLKKKELSFFDILKIDAILFTGKDYETESFDQQHRSYSKTAILDILNFKKKNNLNIHQVAMHFKLSRNTVAKWMRLFCDEIA